LVYALLRELPDLRRYVHFQFRVHHGGILRIGLVILSCIGHTVFANERLILNSLLQKLVEAWRNRAIPAKAASFALVGVVNTLIDVNVFAIAYGIFDILLIPANLLAWLVAVSFSYAANAMTTFGPESGQVLTVRDYVKFVMSGAAGGLIATTALVIASKFVPVITAKLISIFAGFAANFLLSNFYVFRSKRGDSE
jgi:putative flippase GtrA